MVNSKAEQEAAACSFSKEDQLHPALSQGCRQQESREVIESKDSVTLGHCEVVPPLYL